MRGVTVSSSGTMFFTRSTSVRFMLQYRPFWKPLYGLVVSEGNTMQVLWAKPSKFFSRSSLKPLPPPESIMSMNTPQNTPKPVRRLLERFLMRESSISLNVSLSILIRPSALQWV